MRIQNIFASQLILQAILAAVQRELPSNRDSREELTEVKEVVEIEVEEATTEQTDEPQADTMTLNNQL